MKKIFYIFLLGALFLGNLILLNSCKKFVQIDPPKTQAELNSIFADDQTATSAIVGLYVRMVSTSRTFSNGAITIYPALSADEFINVSSNSDYDPFRINSLLPTNTIIYSNFWNSAYQSIYQANAAIEGINASTALSLPVKKLLLGEMLYIRALHYFYMVNLFGDVPLVTSSDYTVNGIMPRTSTASIYQQIISDLTTAKDLLTDSYATSVNTRPTKGAASALLARVYLYQGNWSGAESMASEVIGSGKYSMESINNVFLSTSKEAIFSLMKSTANTAEGTFFVPGNTTTIPLFAATSYLLNAFDAGDNRKANWLKSNIVNSVTYYYPYKYKVRSSTTVTEYYVVQRLAELYLIRSEARLQQNNLSGSIDDVDIIRSRAGAATIKSTNPGISKADLLTAIMKERQTELFAEWGHRWFDLKRTGNADDLLKTIKSPNWQPEDKLYPIPLTEIRSNPFLTQNPGYIN